MANRLYDIKGNYLIMDPMGDPIKVIEEETDLEVTFDNELNFTKHVITCVNKGNQRVGLMRRNFRFLNKQIFLIVYIRVPPVGLLEYCSTVCYVLHERESRLTEKVQRRHYWMNKSVKFCQAA